MEGLLHLLCPRTTLERKAVYDNVKADLGSLCGHFLIDLEQNCQFGSSPGPEVPSLNTHSEIFSYTAERLAISKEYLYMQGIDADSAISWEHQEHQPDNDELVWFVAPGDATVGGKRHACPRLRSLARLRVQQCQAARRFRSNGLAPFHWHLRSRRRRG